MRSEEEMDTLIAGYKQLLLTLLAIDPCLFDTGLRSKLPEVSGIYRILRRGSDWRDSIYVGESGHLRRRIYDCHYTGNRSVSTLKRKLIKCGEFLNEKAIQTFLGAECCVQFMELPGERERVWLQHFAIAVLKPLHND
jgi:hypothetical protein